MQLKVSFKLGNMSSREAVAMYNADVVAHLQRLMDEQTVKARREQRVNESAKIAALIWAYNNLKEFLVNVEIVD